MTPALPNRIGRYEVVDRLGRGGMGVVYLAKDPVLGRTVALKMLTEDNEELRERFAREARSAAALDHTNIVTIYDVGESNGHPFIAMKYLDGETMAELIRRRAAITLGRKLELMGELCAGLGYAHRNGIVHRDIKPANLMITTDGTLKILDFGIARVTTEATHSGLTRIGTLMGSPHYMSPEQAEGLPVDERSDIFSVGLVLYELLSFTRAFPGDLSHVVLHNIVHKEPRPIRELVPDIDSDLEQIVAKGVVKDPSGRYQTLVELGTELERLQGHLDKAEKTVVVRRDSQGVQEKSKTGGSGGKSLSNWREIDDRRTALIESHLAEASGHLEAERYEEAVSQCEHVLVISPDDPRALELIQRANRAVDARHVREWLADAETLISRGAITDAERLVAQAIQLQPDSPEGQAAVARLKERRREQERAAERARSVRSALMKALASMEAGAFEAAMRSAGEALAFDPASDEARRLLEKAKAAIEERDARIAHERHSTEIVASARKLAAKGGVDEALGMLRGFSPPHQVVTDAIADLEREAVAQEKRRREARGAEERRQRQAELEHQAELDLQAERELEGTHLGVDPDQATRVIRPERRPAQVPETVAGPAAWYRKPAIGVAAGVLLIVGLVAVGWSIWGPAPDAGRANPPGGNSPGPAVDYARVLADAEAQATRGDLLSAIAQALKIPAGAQEYARVQDLLGRIRTAAASKATAARQTALAAGAATQDAFQDADRIVKQAEVAPDAEAAVRLYEGAQQSFERAGLAASAGLTLAQLMQQARDALRRGNSKDAIAYAAQAFGRDASYQPAIQFLADQRRQAAFAAQAARQRAMAEGATEENSATFKNARSLESAAEKFSAPPETGKAVDAYGKARGEFEKAYASAHDARVVSEALRRADQRLKNRDAVGARSELDTVQSKDPNNGALQALRKRISDLEAELTKESEAAAAAADAKRRADELFRRSKPLDDAQAIKLLEEATNLDQTNAEIRLELERRQKSLAAAGRSGRGAGGNAAGTTGPSGGPPKPSPTDAVQSALREFAATYKGTKNNEDWSSTAVLPAITFRSATEAVALWNVTVYDRNAQGARKPDRRKYEFVLKQSAQGWKVETFAYRGSW